MERSAPEKLLCLKNLRPLDGAVIRVFLKLLESKPKTRHSWTSVLCANAPADTMPDVVLMSASAELPPPPAHVRALVTVLAYPDEPVPDWVHRKLIRPLQFEDFLNILHQAEENPAHSDVKQALAECMMASEGQLLHTAPQPALPASAVARAAAVAAAAPPEKPPEKPVAPANKIGSEQPHPILAFLDPLHIAQFKFKIRKWPAGHLLTQNRQFSRLAAFLLSRHTSFYDLVQAARCDADTVRLFLRQMYTAELLDVLNVPASPEKSPALSAPSPTTIALAPAVATKPAVRPATTSSGAPLRGLIDSFRRKLGMDLV